MYGALIVALHPFLPACNCGYSWNKFCSTTLCAAELIRDSARNRGAPAGSQEVLKAKLRHCVPDGSVADIMNRHATHAARSVLSATDVADLLQWHATYAVCPITCPVPMELPHQHKYSRHCACLSIVIATIVGKPNVRTHNLNYEVYDE